MRKSIAAGALAIALLTCLPGVALANSGSFGPSAPSATAGVWLPLAGPPSPTTPPPGFSTNARKAIKAAEVSPTMAALHAREHPMSIQALVWAGRSWFVDFFYRGKRVAEVVESGSGRVTGVWTGPQAIAPYTRGNFAPLFGSWWVLLPFSLLFLLPFVDLRRPWRMLHLDALVLLSLLVSYLLFDHAHLEPAVWLAYPPLLYLLVRMLRIGWRGAADGRRAPSPLLSVRVLAVGLTARVLGTDVEIGGVSPDLEP